MPKIKFDIRNRFTNAVQCTVEIDCDENASESVKLGLAVRGANLDGANLDGAYLRGAYLGGAYLRGANLDGAYLDGAYLGGANLGGAYLGGANLDGAYLDGANLGGAYLGGANLGGAYLGGANLRGAYLRGAYLGGAYLGGANLDGANLDGAYLGGANLDDQWIIQGPFRSDGYPFFLQKLTADTEPMVKAGCRYFTVAQAHEHWAATRANTPLGAETMIIIDCLLSLAGARGLLTVKTEQVAA